MRARWPLSPDFIAADEAVSALDVSVQAQNINLLQDLQEELGPDLSVHHPRSGMVAQISNRIAVMYVGKLVEYAPTKIIFSKPMHPYTRALLSAIPVVDPNVKFAPMVLDGEIPNPANLPTGCRFNTRCPFARDACRQIDPEWRQVAPMHFVACHFAEELMTDAEDR